MKRKINTATCKVLITGGSGFIGTNLVESLISKNIKILNLDIVAPKNHKHKNLWQNISMLDFKELQKQFLQFMKYPKQCQPKFRCSFLAWRRYCLL